MLIAPDLNSLRITKKMIPSYLTFMIKFIVNLITEFHRNVKKKKVSFLILGKSQGVARRMVLMCVL